MKHRNPRLLKRLRLALEAPALRLAWALIPRLPRPAILILARGLGTAAYYLSARNRRLGRENLDLAFGSTIPAAHKRRILRKSLQYFSLTMLDLIWFSRNTAERMARWFQAAPSMQQTVQRRTARVAVTGHFGNWELIGRYAAQQGLPLMSVAMPQPNPEVEFLLQQARQVTGQIIVPRQGALKKLVRFLRMQGTVALLLDQNTSPAEGGIFALFFGRPVAVSPAAGLLAARTGAEIVFAYALPRPDGSYVGEVSHCISPEEIAAEDPARVTAALAQKITELYEQAICRQPEFWLWSYKRWRYIPPGMPADQFPSYAKPVGG